VSRTDALGSADSKLQELLQKYEN